MFVFVLQWHTKRKCSQLKYKILIAVYKRVAKMLNDSEGIHFTKNDFYIKMLNK